MLNTVQCNACSYCASIARVLKDLMKAGPCMALRFERRCDLGYTPPRTFKTLIGWHKRFGNEFGRTALFWIGNGSLINSPSPIADIWQRTLSMTLGRVQTVHDDYIKGDLPLNVPLDSLAGQPMMAAPQPVRDASNSSSFFIETMWACPNSFYFSKLTRSVNCILSWVQSSTNSTAATWAMNFRQIWRRYFQTLYCSIRGWNNGG